MVAGMTLGFVGRTSLKVRLDKQLLTRTHAPNYYYRLLLLNIMDTNGEENVSRWNRSRTWLVEIESAFQGKWSLT